MASREDRMGIYAQRLIENEYVQENLAQAAESLRAAYRRASKRRVEPTRDEKVRRQVREAALSLREAASALQTGRRKPKKRRGRRVMPVLVLGVGATAAVVASSEELRRKLLGGESARDEESVAGSAAESSPR
jgi:acyl-CoA reductase-like NAD-dependent aldehyde dehydrogenase